MHSNDVSVSRSFKFSTVANPSLPISLAILTDETGQFKVRV